MNYQDKNAEIIDRWVKEGWEWGKPVPHEIYKEAENGNWNVLLTPTKFVPHEWFGQLRGKKILGLASGGGQQMPVFALQTFTATPTEREISMSTMCRPFRRHAP